MLSHKRPWLTFQGCCNLYGMDAGAIARMWFPSGGHCRILVSDIPIFRQKDRILHSCFNNECKVLIIILWFSYFVQLYRRQRLVLESIMRLYPKGWGPPPAKFVGNPVCPQPRAGSRVVRIDPLRFLAGCRTRRRNQVQFLFYILACVIWYCCLLGPILCIVSFHCYVCCLLVVLVKLSVLAK